jgi:ABC-type transporter Mla subunit MlaD
MRALPRKIERHTLALGLIVTALGGLIGLFAWASTGGVSFGGRYPFTVILPGSTPPIPPGAQVRVAGKIAGAVSSTEPSPSTLRVNAYLNGAYAPLGRGARIHVGVLLGTTLVYLVVSPGDRTHPLPAGTVIPENRVTLSSSLPQALEAFNAATRQALARNITVIGGGWAGLGRQTNGAIADQALDYKLGTPILKALVPAPGALGAVITRSAVVASALGGQRPDDIAALTTASASFWQTLATRDRVGQLVASLPAAEQQLQATYPDAQRTLSAARTAARAFEPLALAIAHLDPSFAALFATGGSLTDATRRFNGIAPATLKAFATVLPELRAPAAALPVLVPYGRTVSAAIGAYAGDIKILATDLAAVTSYQYGGHTALRITGTLACAGGRNPYPKPGQAEKDSKAC